MKKPVPDPPPFDFSRFKTRGISFGPHDFNGKCMFNVSEELCAEDALVHACLLLNCLRASACDAASHLTANDHALVIGIAQQAEMAKALVDSVLAGLVCSGRGGGE
ncbi:DUF6124 family protein [Pseudomonas putida]|uniref:DUF3077 domain-containing protein n=1 Tax=Pseudomonas putida TaxID=303 RepID=A0A1Q9R6U1_PSEPU|nr:DUF3077 domain-containing protein [Pseudomonas putida]OLS63139.1 hypothetical protein PSEMO_18440 [Pseudomonas putida]